MIIIRAFIGIDLEDELKDYIITVQQKFRTHAIKGRWKNRDNLHLTLKFLDDISLGQKEQIDKAMMELSAGIKPFRLGISGLGIFQGRDAVRVLWMGLSGDIQELQSVHKNIDNKLYPIGLPYEKRSYKPHITIGQDIVFKYGFDEIRNMIGEVRFSPFKVDSLSLFKSEQVQNKRIYTRVAEYDLG